jgi:hypothetical protein
MAQDNANPIKTTAEQGNPAKAVASKLQKQVGKQEPQQIPDATQSSDDLFHSVLLEVGYKSTGKISNFLA